MAELFDKPLDGSTLGECYSAVAAVANRWLNLLGGTPVSERAIPVAIFEMDTGAIYGVELSCSSAIRTMTQLEHWPEEDTITGM
ncbi:hypothetical protein LINPERPRIM_LOCUS38339 [Linum perenne]